MLSKFHFKHFNPRPPWGGRLPIRKSGVESICISIHALRGEGDTATKKHSSNIDVISIHALRGEGDGTGKSSIFALIAISIHALRGEGDIDTIKKK